MSWEKCTYFLLERVEHIDYMNGNYLFPCSDHHNKSSVQVQLDERTSVKYFNWNDIFDKIILSKINYGACIKKLSVIYTLSI